MLSDKQIQALRAPFPSEALTPDTSRGFELTSIKAAYVVERLNDVFGTCGVGWRYVHAPFETLVLADQRTEVLTEVALQYRVATDDQRGGPPIAWCDGWYPDHDRERVWSEPVYAVGGHGLGRGGVPYTDARKSAVTDGLTKAAAMLGIGHHVFKGLVRSNSHGSSGSSSSGGSNGIHSDGRGPRGDDQSHTPSPEAADATAFWKLYHTAGKAAGMPLETAKDLTQGGDWARACAQLRARIDRATVTTP